MIGAIANRGSGLVMMAACRNVETYAAAQVRNYEKSL